MYEMNSWLQFHTVLTKRLVKHAYNVFLKISWSCMSVKKSDNKQLCCSKYIQYDLRRGLSKTSRAVWRPPTKNSIWDYGYKHKVLVFDQFVPVAIHSNLSSLLAKDKVRCNVAFRFFNSCPQVNGWPTVNFMNYQYQRCHIRRCIQLCTK